jgi:hypothetical protein
MEQGSVKLFIAVFHRRHKPILSVEIRQERTQSHQKCDLRMTKEKKTNCNAEEKVRRQIQLNSPYDASTTRSAFFFFGTQRL